MFPIAPEEPPRLALEESIFPHVAANRELWIPILAWDSLMSNAGEAVGTSMILCTRNKPAGGRGKGSALVLRGGR